MMIQECSKRDCTGLKKKKSRLDTGMSHKQLTPFTIITKRTSAVLHYRLSHHLGVPESCIRIPLKTKLFRLQSDYSWEGSN